MSTNLGEEELLYALSSPKGRKLIWDILALGGLYRQPFVPGNVEVTAFNSGGLNIALILYADCMTVSPDLTAMMISEQGNYDNGRTTDQLNVGRSDRPGDGNFADGNPDERNFEQGALDGTYPFLG